MRNNINTKKFGLFLLVGVLLAGGILRSGDALADSPRDILVVANKNVPNNSVTMDEVRSIFLKQRKNWTGGAKIIAIHSPEGTDLRVSFQRLVLGMAPEEELIYWFAQQARGKGGPPIEFRKALKAVFKISGAVSYIYRQDYKEGVSKLLLVIPAQ